MGEWLEMGAARVSKGEEGFGVFEGGREMNS